MARATKQQVEELEGQVASLKAERDQLLNIKEQQTAEIQRLRGAVAEKNRDLLRALPAVLGEMERRGQ